MTGPEHYKLAEQYAEEAAHVFSQRWCTETGKLDDLNSARWQQAQAQAHFTAALTAAAALGAITSVAVPRRELAEWEKAISPAGGETS